MTSPAIVIFAFTNLFVLVVSLPLLAFYDWRRRTGSKPELEDST